MKIFLKSVKLLKSKNVFSDLLSGNFQVTVVSGILQWIKAVKEIKCLSKLHHAECLKEFLEFDHKARKVHEDDVIENEMQPNKYR